MADVLIVDDDQAVLTLLEVLVTQFGHDVRSATNAEDALLGGLSWDGPGLAPYRDGDELVDLLLRGIGRPRALVFVSALPRHRVRELAERYDARYIHKPFEAREFERVVGEALAEVGSEGLLASIGQAMLDDAATAPDGTEDGSDPAAP